MIPKRSFDRNLCPYGTMPRTGVEPAIPGFTDRCSTMEAAAAWTGADLISPFCWSHYGQIKGDLYRRGMPLTKKMYRLTPVLDSSKMGDIVKFVKSLSKQSQEKSAEVLQNRTLALWNMRWSGQDGNRTRGRRIHRPPLYH